MLTPFEKYLVDRGLLTEGQAVHVQGTGTEGSPLEVLARTGQIPEDSLYRAVAEFCELPFVAASKHEISPEIVREVPARFATHYGFVPLDRRNGTLLVAISDPLNSNVLDDIRLAVESRIEPVVTTPTELTKALKALYGLGAETVERILEDRDDRSETVRLESRAASDLADVTIDASIVKFVNELFREAIHAGATDIHIEPFEDELRVRYRIDGVLHAVPVPSTIRGFQSSIVSRVKVMANLNIAEKRLPQDGKIEAAIGEGRFDLRVSILPTPHGETVNIRILTRSSIFRTLQDLGFLDKDLDQITEFIKRPHGIILVTGPTGSGKTTTLYAALSKLNQLDRKIITIEDPIEYQLKGISQMQILPQIGFSFATGLRSMLRHDPDIMMVGEIRDYETAEMAIRASLTGHLVFSTLHTNDAPSTVTRLIDMGVEPFLVASTMIAALAQRLVRQNCTDCSEAVALSGELVAETGTDARDWAGAELRQGTGCELCRDTGYRGRMAICEIMPFTPAIKELTVKETASNRIKQKARELGMRTLRDAGWARVRRGETTIEEVLRVTADTDAIYD